MLVWLPATPWDLIAVFIKSRLKVDVHVFCMKRVNVLGN